MRDASGGHFPSKIPSTARSGATTVHRTYASREPRSTPPSVDRRMPVEDLRIDDGASDADEKRDGAGAAIEALESRGFAPSDTREKPFDARLFAVDAVSGPIVRRVAGASG